MMKKYSVDEFNLKVSNVEPFVSEKHKGLVISWTSDIGWGEYTIYTVPDLFDPDKIQWVAETETMDSVEDQSFGRKLMDLWIDKILPIE